MTSEDQITSFSSARVSSFFVFWMPHLLLSRSAISPAVPASKKHFTVCPFFKKYHILVLVMDPFFWCAGWMCCVLIWKKAGIPSIDLKAIVTDPKCRLDIFRTLIRRLQKNMHGCMPRRATSTHVSKSRILDVRRDGPDGVIGTGSCFNHALWSRNPKYSA